ncbi:helix-turn-helix transcriptional regulator [Sphingomonas sp.]|jgi:transcriptional regulator with XRE-family HTH domain|uniref:helix-turn-helix domain-containing protein n=1 Tax=Sphingomonas sp. TaxID=28214 RepID=UPI002ED9C1B6
MITNIRNVRRARGMTLDQVARACVPATTAQQIGRLEVGTRTVSVAWLNRIAAALGVTAADLVQLPDRVDLPVAAILDATGARAPTKASAVAAPVPAPGHIALCVTASIGDYRAGDVLWCETLAPEQFARATNRDVLVPRAAGRFTFARLLDRDATRLHLLPPGPGARQQIVANPPWLARVVRLVRDM